MLFIAMLWLARVVVHIDALFLKYISTLSRKPSILYRYHYYQELQYQFKACIIYADHVIYAYFYPDPISFTTFMPIY